MSPSGCLRYESTPTLSSGRDIDAAGNIESACEGEDGS